MEDPFARMERLYAKLSKTEKRVSDYIRFYPDKTVLYSLQALSEKCSVSDASVLRFCRKLGFSGYQDFKAALVPELLRRGTRIYQEVDQNDGYQSTREKFLENLCNDIRKTVALHDENTVDFLSTQIQSATKTVVVGLAGSAGVARIFADCLLGLGFYAVYLSDRVEIERVVACLDQHSLIFGISHSGETSEVVYALGKARENGIPTVGMTNFSSSSVARLAATLLLTTVPETLLGSYSCQPRISQLALLEFISYRISTRLKEGD